MQWPRKTLQINSPVRLWTIESFEAGVWDTVKEVDSEIESFREASKLVHTSFREEKLRIVSPDCKIL